jgi:hypothetical protein
MNATAQAHAYAVIDTAFHDRLYLTLNKQQIPFFSLFDETPEHGLIEIAPLLIDLRHCTDSLITRLLALGQQAPCLTAIRSTRDIAELAIHLRQLHVAQLEDGGNLLLRWYDTRIQPALLAVLEPVQRSTLLSDIDHWSYCDRFGQWVEQTTSAAAPADKAALPLHLNSAQFAALMNSAQPDLVLSHLQKILPDELAATQPSALYALVREHVTAAVALGYENVDEQIQYLLPGLYTSGLATQLAQFEQAVAPAPEVSTSGKASPLADRIAALGDAVWAAGQPLWATAPRQPLYPYSTAGRFPHV